jgi:hypothetical protein
MPKTRTTLTIDDDLLRAVKLRAARTGKRDSEVIEEAVRGALGLDLLDRIWEGTDMGADEAMELALEAQRAARESAG